MIIDVNKEEFFKILNDGQLHSVCFDIETRPEPDDILKRFFKTDKLALPSHPGEFDPAAVKTNHLVDPAKISAKILADKKKYEIAMATWEQTCSTKLTAAWENFVDEAPLSVLYGGVCAIGYGVTDGLTCKVWLDIDFEDEHSLLVNFWNMLSALRQHGYADLISFGGQGFDTPFVLRRSFKYDIKKARISNILDKDKWWPTWHKDIRLLWNFGDKYAKGTLDDIARMLGVPGKKEGMTGDQFWRVLKAGQLDVARDYLRSDIVALYEVSRKMGLVD